MDLDNIINDYYQNNRARLKEVAYNILKNIDKTELADTLITDSYFYINENQEKVRDLIEKGKIEGIIVQFMTKQVHWNKTTFKKTFTSFYSKTDELLDDVESTSSEEEYEDRLEREYEEQKKLAHIEGQKQKLDVPGRILFDLCITGDLTSSGKLAKHLNLNRTTAYNMQKNIKAFLKKGYKDGKQ